MIGLWCLPRKQEEEKKLVIKCGNHECKPRVYDEGSGYIILYRFGEWWFRIESPVCIEGRIMECEAKQIKRIAQANYEMYCERHRKVE